MCPVFVRPVFLLACIGFSLSATPYAYADSACSAVDAANIKLSHTPFHTTTTNTGGPTGTRKSESFVTGGSRYLQIGGQWKKIPYSASDTRLAADTPTVVCAAAGSEAVDGESADVYTVKNKVSDDAASDMRFWVSRKTGLPLRSLIVIDAGGGNKQQMDIHYDYANVQAPI